MRVTVYGDVNCPFSYLASQRVDALLRQGAEVEWRAVEHDPALAMTGTPSDRGPKACRRALAEVRLLATAGERAPEAPPTLVSNSFAATSAYAEAVTDGLEHELRRALFEAIWQRGQHLSSAYDVRDVVSAISYPPHPIESYRCSPDRALPRFGDPTPLGITRALGATTSFAGAPITTAGWLRARRWREDWLAVAAGNRSSLPVVVDEQGGVRSGTQALAFLAELGSTAGLPRAAIAADSALAA
ncbi:DsbA family protein [Actinoplanes sp. NPDC049316]|uniref:DsbA family oxidoreductase n=1 Tax=Actinoplanes sp. NPDC049316 TaxID=3154727 RepID=UPI00342EC65D